MINKTYIVYALLLSGLFSCKNNDKTQIKEESKVVITSINDRVSSTQIQLANNISGFKTVAVLDHHGMAEEDGAYTPPSIVTIFSEPALDSELLMLNQLVGLDLPFKVLTYSEPDTTKVSLAYTSGEFIAKRHNIPYSAMNAYNSTLEQILKPFPQSQISETNLDSVSTNFGLITIKSDYDYNTTVERLKNIVNAQSDTRWFGEIDYKQEAEKLDVYIRPTVLLLFGGPAPGAKAMMTTPKIGLDAFCQKLLVYEDENNTIQVAFNDIVEFSSLYYNTYTKPQELINKRLIQTFTQAIKNSN